MATDTTPDDFDSLTPYERQGYVLVSVEGDPDSYHLARKEYERLEAAIEARKEIFIGEDNRGATVLIRLRRGSALAITGVVDFTPSAIAARRAEVAADKYRSGTD